MRLTKKLIEAVEPQPRVQFLRDDDVPGLAVRITPAGHRAFVFEKRVNGRNRRMTLGTYGALTLEQARQLARVTAGEIAGGADPVAEKRKRAHRAVTLGEVFEEYLRVRELRPRTTQDMRCALRDLSDWTARPVTEITRDMVTARHMRLGERSKARANGTMRYLRAWLNFAAERYATTDGPLLTHNPVKRLSAVRGWYRVDRRRTFIKPHELRPWMLAVQGLGEVPDRAPGTGWDMPKLRHGDMQRDFYMLLALTGLRRSEALGLRWVDVDFAGRTLTVRGTKNHRDHTLPLPGYLVDMLRERKAQAGSTFVFSESDGQRLQNLRYGLERVAKVSGVKFCPHDLRRTFATVAESLDLPAYALKHLLNHSSGADVTAGYVVVTTERLRAPMERICDYMLKTGGLREVAPVVSLQARRVGGNGA